MFLAHEAGPVSTDSGMLSLVAERSLDDLPHPDVVVVPGGLTTREFLDDRPLLGRTVGAHERSQWTTSVCTGSLAPGGRRRAGGAGGHSRTGSSWRDCASSAPSPSIAGWWSRARWMTAAWVSSGIDMGLTAGRPASPGTSRADDPALNRVRPPAAVRLRPVGQGFRRRWSSACARWSLPPRGSRRPAATLRSTRGTVGGDELLPARRVGPAPRAAARGVGLTTGSARC